MHTHMNAYPKYEPVVGISSRSPNIFVASATTGSFFCSHITVQEQTETNHDLLGIIIGGVHVPKLLVHRCKPLAHQSNLVL